MLTPGIASKWLDRKHADDHYGVRRSDARADRPDHVADRNANAELSLRSDYSIDERWTVFGSLQYIALGNGIGNSPLTDRADETMVFVGYLYRRR